MPPPIWFAAALAPMVASQIMRLQRAEPVWWVLWDVSGRLAALLILAAIPDARKVAFATSPTRVPNWEVAAWLLCSYFFYLFTWGWIHHHSQNLPSFRVGSFPAASGFLRIFDLTIGLALVAYSEEIIFRRCARYVFGVRNRIVAVIATSLLFGAYHWWKGLTNVIDATVFGAVAMVIYLRAGTLTPAVLLHYMVDFRLSV